jgi:prohibitin 1
VQAARLISKSLAENGPGLVELRKIDAAVEIAQTLSRSRGVSYLPGGSNMLLNLGGAA